MSYWFWESSLPDLSLYLSQSHNLELLATSTSSNATYRAESRTQHTLHPLAQTLHTWALTNPIACSLTLLGAKNLASFLHWGWELDCQLPPGFLSCLVPSRQKPAGQVKPQALATFHSHPHLHLSRGGQSQVLTAGCTLVLLEMQSEITLCFLLC